MMREIYIITVPATKANIMDARMPVIISRVLSVFIYWLSRLKELSLLDIFIAATATEAPNSSNTSETVVDVGRPKVLKKSINTMSVIITAMKMIIISEK